MKQYKKEFKEAKRIDNVEEVVNQLSKLTDKNYHTKANILLAKTLGLDKYATIFQMIDKIVDIENSLPRGLSDYSYELIQRVKNYGEQNFPEDFDKLYSAM